MSQKSLRNILIIGTIISFAVLFAMTADSLRQVTTTRTPELTDQVVSGKKVWQEKNCNDCHTILGIGGYYAADLTKIAGDRDADWLRRLLKDPKSVKGNSTMPGQNLTDEEADNLVAFLQWVSKIDTNDWPPKPMLKVGSDTAKSSAKTTEASGKELFEEKCASCHDSSIGKGHDVEYIRNYIKDPKSQNSDTSMPTIPLSNADIDVLTELLAGSNQ